MTPTETASLAISLLAILVSILATIISWRYSSKQNQLQERMVVLETDRERERDRVAKSASLRARVERGKDYKLQIVNVGMSEARSIRTLLDGQPVLSHALIPRGVPEITHLGSGTSTSYLLAVAMGANPIIVVSLSWEDDSGISGVWSSELNLF